MIDAIDTITEAIPCNIVYGRRQAAEGIARALSTAGFTIMSKKDVEAVRRQAFEEAIKECADIADSHNAFATYDAILALSAEPALKGQQHDK